MSKNGKILVVDDDLTARKSLEEALTGAGFVVITAESGEEALWRLDNESCGAVFTEIALRGMSGLEVATEIHRGQPGLPVIIVTGDNSDAAQQRAATVGVAAYLHKPLSPEQVAEIAARVLPVKATPQPQAGELNESAPASEGVLLRLRNIVLFLMAPFVALGYILIFPLVGLGTLSWWAIKAQRGKPAAAGENQSATAEQPGILNTLAALLGAAIIGVVCAVAGPLIGVGLVVFFSFQAWGRLGARAIRSDQT
jgi:CheY-like chemotaxis protein